MAGKLIIQRVNEEQYQGHETRQSLYRKLDKQLKMPIDIIRMMGAKKGDKFTFIYQPADTLMLTRMGCDA
jgi:hypothetical protein